MKAKSQMQKLTAFPVGEKQLKAEGRKEKKKKSLKQEPKMSQ